MNAVKLVYSQGSSNTFKSAVNFKIKFLKADPGTHEAWQGKAAVLVKQGRLVKFEKRYGLGDEEADVEPKK